jgi:hypothetical protein
MHKLPPVVMRVPPAAHHHGHADTGSNWHPAIIPWCVPPAYPCRCPFVARNPEPSIIWIIIPSSIMERTPSPVVIGNPGPAVVGPCPITVAAVRGETRSCIRHPDIAVLWIIHPGAIGAQLVVKHLESDSHALGLNFSRCSIRNHEKHGNYHDCFEKIFHFFGFLIFFLKVSKSRAIQTIIL